MTDDTLDLPARARLRAVGRAIRAARGSTSQTELSARLGVPQTTLSRWERGTVDFGLEQLRALEYVLELEPGTLLLAGGYVPGREPREGVVREISRASFTDAMRMVQAAEELTLGVELSNGWRLTGGSDYERVLEWAVVLTEEAPGAEN